MADVLQVAIDAKGAKRGADQYTAATRRMQTAGTKLGRGVDKVDKKVKGLGGTAAKVGKVIGGLFGGIALTGAIRSATRTIISFEDTMQTVLAVSRATGAEFDALSAKARRMGASTRFSATEAGEGLLFLSRAGFTAQQSMDSLPSVLNLAAAGAIELGTAADFASNILTAFQMNAEEMARVTDTLVIAANSSNTSVLQLAEAMKFVAPISSALGITLEETAAAIGVLGDSGIQGAMAGTNLRMVMLRLLKPSKEATDTLKEMGLTLDDVNPTTNTAADIMERLADGNLDAEKAVKIFSTRVAGAALILSRGTDKIRELTKAEQELTGETERVAAIMEDDLEGAIKGMFSAVSELQLVLGDGGLKDSLREIVDFTTDVIRVWAGLPDEFIRAGDAARRAARIIEGLGTAVATLIALQLAKWAIAAAAAMRALMIVMLSNPFGFLALAVTGAIATLVVFRDELITIGEDSTKVSTVMKNSWSLVVDTFVDLGRETQKAFENMEKAAQAAGNRIQNLLDMVDIAVPGLGSRMGQALGAMAAVAVSPLLPLAEAISNTAAEVAHKSAIEDSLAAREKQVEAIKNAEQARSSAANKAAADLRQALEDEMDILNLSAGAAKDFTVEIQAMFAELQFEQEALGLSNDERQLRLNLLQLESLATEANIANIDQLSSAYSEQFRELVRGRKLIEIANTMGDAFADAFTDIVTGATSAQDAIRRLIQEIARLVVQQTIAQPVANTISQVVKFVGGAVGGAAGGAITNGLASNSTSGAFTAGGVAGGDTPVFAKGGLVTKPTYGLIGEAGPELIIPLKGGRNLAGGGILGGLTDLIGQIPFKDLFFDGGPLQEIFFGIKELGRQFITGQGINEGGRGPLNVSRAFESLLPGISGIVSGVQGQSLTSGLNSLLSFGIGTGSDILAAAASHLIPAFSPQLLASNPLAGLASLAFPAIANTFGNPNFGLPERLASGGIISGATVFQSGNRSGLIGEAGPEAVLPLTRDGSGRLGVTSVGGGGSGTTVINMTVQTPNADSFRKSTRQIADGVKRAMG